MPHDWINSSNALKECMRLLKPEGIDHSAEIMATFSNLNTIGLVGRVNVTFFSSSELPHIECPLNIMTGFRVKRGIFHPDYDTFSFDATKRVLQVSGTVKSIGEPFNFALSF